MRRCPVAAAKPVCDRCACALAFAQVAADLRVVLELMEEEGTYFGGVDGATHLARLVQLLDPFQGVPPSFLHR